MKKNILFTILSGFATFVWVGGAGAQSQINRSAYFLEGATYRHELNPAFMGERGYVGMPGLGNLSVGAQGTAGAKSFWTSKGSGRMTVTIGAGKYKVGQDYKEWINFVDKQLYVGKCTGKNKVVC